MAFGHLCFYPLAPLVSLLRLSPSSLWGVCDSLDPLPPHSQRFFLAHLLSRRHAFSRVQGVGDAPLIAHEGVFSLSRGRFSLGELSRCFIARGSGTLPTFALSQAVYSRPSRLLSGLIWGVRDGRSPFRGEVLAPTLASTVSWHDPATTCMAMSSGVIKRLPCHILAINRARTLHVPDLIGA